jgi:hypothetical protein
MRWRVLMNVLERTGARDTLERLSLAVEQIGPIIAIGLLVPSAAVLAALGAYAGYRLGSGEATMVFDGLRIPLVAACGLSIAGPLIMPTLERTSAVRLLLLPIPRNILYVAQVAGAITDPWILLALPILLSIPAGMAAAGAFGGAALSSVAAGLTLVVLLGLSSLSSFGLQLVLRDRRRGELVALLFVVVLPMVAMLPGLLGAQHSRDQRRAARIEQGNPRAQHRMAPSWLTEAGRGVWAVVPTELFVDVTRRSSNGRPDGSVFPIVALTASGVLLHALGLLTFGRLLDAPASTSRRQTTGAGRAWSWRLPGLSPGTAAVALGQVRLAMRTPRGRSILIAPLLVFVMLSTIMWRGGGLMELGLTQVNGGLGLAIFGSAVCLLSILPFAMNQFAVDGSGLTLALLSPLDIRQLLTGKAIGNGIIAGAPALLCVIAAAVLFPGGTPALWLSIPPALFATYVLAAPPAAAVSAVFPRAVELNSIGRGSNAHGVAALLGIVTLAVAGAPSILLAILTTALGRSVLAPVLIVVWCGIALAISRALFHGAAAIVDSRRENLAIVAGD